MPPMDDANDRQAARERPYWIEITGQAAATNRYAWSQTDDTDTAFGTATLAPTFAMSGTSAVNGWPAYEINGRTDVPTGAKVLAHLSAGGEFWIFLYDGAATSTAAACDSACGSLVGLATAATLQLELVCATGSFAAIDTAQFDAVYAFGSGGTWTFEVWDDGMSDWVTFDLDYEGGTGSAVFTWNATPLPTFALDGVTLTARCLGADGTFAAGPRNGINGDGGYTPADDCESNELVLKVSCVCTPIDGWQGEGWYCVIDSGGTCGVNTPEVVELLEEDKCDDSILICSDRYDTEGDAEAACVPPPGTNATTCCPDDLLPEDIVVTFAGTLAGLGAQTLSHTTGSTWRKTGLACGGGAGAGNITLTCSGTTWTLAGFTEFSFDATETDCNPLTISFSGTVLSGACAGAASATVG